MKDGLGDLLPSRAFSKRMLEMENELKRARAFQRRHSKSPDTLGRWGLEQPQEAQQEEGWFITYLDMMTLLLVVMIVMLAFSGTLKWQDRSPSVLATASAPKDTERVAAADPAVAHAHIDEETTSPAQASDPTLASLTSSASPDQGNGVLPAGKGLLPGHEGFLHPADVGPLPKEAHATPAQASLPDVTPTSSSPGLADLYPGWTPEDLAASFIGPPRPKETTSETTHQAPPLAAAAQAEDTPSEGELMAASLALRELGNDVEVVVNERSVSFRVNNEILFDSSQADLSRSGLSVLRRIVSVLKESNHVVTVEGHTDSVPVRRNVRFPSNWELSSARAGSVVRYLQANGIASQRLKAVGYADTRPIADNHSPEGRASNRRVELLIEKRD